MILALHWLLKSWRGCGWGVCGAQSESAYPNRRGVQYQVKGAGWARGRAAWAENFFLLRDGAAEVAFPVRTIKTEYFRVWRVEGWGGRGLRRVEYVRSRQDFNVGPSGVADATQGSPWWAGVEGVVRGGGERSEALQLGLTSLGQAKLGAALGFPEFGVN